jgi:5'-methylthioadenosine phosphorylase
VQDILGHLTANARSAQAVVADAIRRLPPERRCKCGSALSHALITDRSAIPEATRRKLGLLVDKYLSS